MATTLEFRDESPTCYSCGCPADNGYIRLSAGERDPETGYIEDERVICAACNKEDGRYDAADLAMDMAEGF